MFWSDEVQRAKRLITDDDKMMCQNHLQWVTLYMQHAPDTHQLLSDTTLCVYTATRTYIDIWCRTTHGNKTHIPYDGILYTKGRLCCQ